MFSLAAFLVYISVLVLTKQCYWFFSILVLIGIYLIFLEYNGKKYIQKWNTKTLILGAIAGFCFGVYTLNKFGECHFETNNKKLTGQVIKVNAASYILELKHNSHRDRIQFRTPTDHPEVYLWDILEFECTKWRFNNENGFFKILLSLQAVRNTCIKGSILNITEYSSLFNQIRAKIRSRINQSLNELPLNSYARGFLMGENDTINPVELNTFRKMGVAHLFSPSGLHMGLLYGSLYLPFYFLRIPALGEVIGLLSCFCYLCILDFRISLLRSFFFILIFFVLKLIRRKSEGKYTLYMSCVFLEILFPLSSFSPSFILSFFITLIIILLFPIFKKVLMGNNSRLKDHLALTLSASAGSCFISLYFFNYYHPLSILYNFFLVPPAGFFLGTTILYIFFEPFKYLIFAGDFFYRHASWMHYFIIEKNIPGINLLFSRLWVILFFLLTVFLLFNAIKRQFWYLRKYYIKLFLLLLPLFVINYCITSQPISGQIAFPYGIIQYSNRNLVIAGYPADYYQNKFANTLQNMDLPFKDIYAPKKLTNLLHDNFVHPMQPILSTGSLERKGRIQVKEHCYFFIPAFRLNEVSLSENSQCLNIYLIHSKKHSLDIMKYKKVFSALLPFAKIYSMNYGNWHWVYNND